MTVSDSEVIGGSEESNVWCIVLWRTLRSLTSCPALAWVRKTKRPLCSRDILEALLGIIFTRRRMSSNKDDDRGLVMCGTLSPG